MGSHFLTIEKYLFIFRSCFEKHFLDLAGITTKLENDSLKKKKKKKKKRCRFDEEGIRERNCSVKEEQASTMAVTLCGVWMPNPTLSGNVLPSQIKPSSTALAATPHLVSSSTIQVRLSDLTRFIYPPFGCREYAGKYWRLYL